MGGGCTIEVRKCRDSKSSVVKIESGSEKMRRWQAVGNGDGSMRMGKRQSRRSLVMAYLIGSCLNRRESVNNKNGAAYIIVPKTKNGLVGNLRECW